MTFRFMNSIGRSQRGSGGGLEHPQSETQPPWAPPPMKWHLYIGLRRAAIVSPCKSPLPVLLPHFEKSGYAPDERVFFSLLLYVRHEQYTCTLDVKFYYIFAFIIRHSARLKWVSQIASIYILYMHFIWEGGGGGYHPLHPVTLIILFFSDRPQSIPRSLTGVLVLWHENW